jgi:hypothetical protein
MRGLPVSTNGAAALLALVALVMVVSRGDGCAAVSAECLAARTGADEHTGADHTA